MAMTDRELAVLIEIYGEPVETGFVECTTNQWNFPHERNRPWVSDHEDRAGRCYVCDQVVPFERLEPARNSAYTCIAEPHQRVVTQFLVSGDELAGLNEAISREYGGLGPDDWHKVVHE